MPDNLINDSNADLTRFSELIGLIYEGATDTQIKHIYSKLGVDTRTRFVKLLLGLARHRA